MFADRSAPPLSSSPHASGPHILAGQPTQVLTSRPTHLPSQLTCPANSPARPTASMFVPNGCLLTPVFTGHKCTMTGRGTGTDGDRRSPVKLKGGGRAEGAGRGVTGRAAGAGRAEGRRSS
ncbi:hypothetical protein OH76DRAFT_362931 [Lentinus brumalis]|uniref:Uncharacterized protein n=1 Tax=Lentinus brumalis TaxID=2498619 RepID=A0A371DE67_9APHY|nr:hypothetical protein OH76DRAFT_362931 [Polyporus brumalis]